MNSDLIRSRLFLVWPIDSSPRFIRTKFALLCFNITPLHQTQQRSE